VVSTPLKNMKPVGMMTFPIYEKLNVPNHQPDKNRHLLHGSGIFKHSPP
jgi:hypothetical protein